MKQPAVYIVTNKPNGVLYVGVTSTLLARINIHKNGAIKGFSKRYNCTQLVYYECFETMEQAILREKQLKAGSRHDKIAVIENFNPQWHDLYSQLHI